MEKKNESGIARIVLIGAESTGKSTLTAHLAEKLGIPAIQEYARLYIEALAGHYTEEDVKHIAKWQMKEESKYLECRKLYIADTDVLITQIWLEQKYGTQCPEIESWILKQQKHSLYLLCIPDLEWVLDHVRENGGENRMKLHHIYLQRLKLYNLRFEEVGGHGESRFAKAYEIIKKII